ncbi:hypothetical protein VTI74DRAFT_2845 [Chaetomium olivicolor]
MRWDCRVLLLAFCCLEAEAGDANADDTNNKKAHHHPRAHQTILYRLPSSQTTDISRLPTPLPRDYHQPKLLQSSIGQCHRAARSGSCSSPLADFLTSPLSFLLMGKHIQKSCQTPHKVIPSQAVVWVGRTNERAACLAGCAICCWRWHHFGRTNRTHWTKVG